MSENRPNSLNIDEFSDEMGPSTSALSRQNSLGMYIPCTPLFLTTGYIC